MKSVSGYLGAIAAIALLTASMYMLTLEITYAVMGGLLLFFFSFFRLDWAVCALIFLMPFNLQLIPLNIRFLNSVPELLMFLIFIVFILRLVLNRINLKKYAALIPVALFVFSVLLSLLRAEVIDYVQLYYQFSVILLFIIVISVARSQIMINRIILSVALSTFIVSVAAIVQFILKENPQLFSLLFANEPGSILYGDGFHRSIGSFTQPNALGGFLLLGLPFLILLIQHPLKMRYPVIPAVMLVFVLLALFSTLSRSAILGFGAAILFFLFLGAKWKRKLRFGVLGMVILFMFVSFFPVLTNIIQERFSNLLFGEFDSHIVRLVLYQTAVKMFESSPLFGIGLGNFIVSQDILEVKGAHNVFLNILAELGLFGLLSFLAIQFFVLKNNLKFLRQERGGVSSSIALCCSLSIIGFLVAGLFDSLLHSFVISSYFWVIVAISLVATETKKVESDENRNRRKIPH